MKVSEKQLVELIAFVRGTLQHNRLVGNLSWETRNNLYDKLRNQQDHTLVDLSRPNKLVEISPAAEKKVETKEVVVETVVKKEEMCLFCMARQPQVAGHCLISNSEGKCSKCGRENAILYSVEDTRK